MSEEKKVFRMARYTYDAWRELRKKDFGENGFDDKEEEYLLDEEDITELAKFNIDQVCAIAAWIMDICRVPLSFETILQRLFTDYSLSMNFEQYVLVGSTVRSYLSWLKDQGKIAAVFDQNMLLWQRT